MSVAEARYTRNLQSEDPRRQTLDVSPRGVEKQPRTRLLAIKSGYGKPTQ